MIHEEHAGFGIRLVALIIDVILLTVLGLILWLITEGSSVYFQWLINILYYVLFTGLKGQTPGKMVVGIHAVNESGEVPGVGQAFLREIIGNLVSSIVILLGYIWVAFDDRKQGWHDKIPRTFVIK